MARRVFFSFHYERDIWRANIVRNSWVTQEREDAGFWDAGLWERAKRRGDEAVRTMIDNALIGTSVTAVLIGAETSNRKWVRYEIIKSYNMNNGVLGIYVHNIKDSNGDTDTEGNNQFGPVTRKNDKDIYFWQLFPTYDWIADDGYKNFGKWVETAAGKAGR